jgi:hypothetical protein
MVRLTKGARTLLCSAFIGMIERIFLKLFDISLAGQVVALSMGRSVIG